MHDHLARLRSGCTADQALPPFGVMARQCREHRLAFFGAGARAVRLAERPVALALAVARRPAAYCHPAGSPQPINELSLTGAPWSPVAGASGRRVLTKTNVSDLLRKPARVIFLDGKWTGRDDRGAEIRLGWNES